uniref:Calponin-homology (CH) domain-containing protein n=1 Tax=Elaeophora elaphi TaxID=1147741 RepID=A0A0R3RSE5_9BILA
MGEQASRQGNSSTDDQQLSELQDFNEVENPSLLVTTGLHVEDLFVDLTDGYNLIALLEALSAEKLPRENGYTRFHRIQNVQYCLDFLKKKNIKTVNIRPEDIVEGNPKLTLGLIWTIILNFQVSVIKQRQREVSGSQVCYFCYFKLLFMIKILY